MTDFSKSRAAFHIPEGTVYLDGNSLGPLPRAASQRVASMMDAEWGEMLITGWNRAGWMAQPEDMGNRIGRLIGAETDSVVLGDTLSIKVYQALAAALNMVPDRKIVLSDTGNFPTDLYMAEGLISTLDKGHQLKTVAPETVADHLTEDVAVLMLTEVDYRTGRKHDMQYLTLLAHSKGIITVWDLAHSAGAVPVDLAGTEADFAVGCTYKYLNGGPGAPAFIYVAPHLAGTARTALSGWHGHDAPFAFEPNYRPRPDIARMRVGTPPVVQMAALEAALDVWDAVDINDVRTRSIELSERFREGIKSNCPSLELNSPKNPAHRGSQISFRHPEGYAIVQAAIERGVVGDFRAPDVLRFGITPLFIGERDIDRAISVLADIMAQDLWDQPRHKRRAAVT